MNSGSATARSTAPFLVAGSERQSPLDAISIDFEELCRLGMEQAMAVEKAWLDAIMNLNSCIIDLYTHGFGFATGLDTVFDTAAQSLASSMEGQLNWFSTLLGYAPGCKVASSTAPRGRSNAEALARSADIAMGAAAATQGSTVASHTRERTQATTAVTSSPQAGPEAEVLEHGMDVALGARKAG